MQNCIIFLQILAALLTKLIFESFDFLADYLVESNVREVTSSHVVLAYLKL